MNHNKRFSKSVGPGSGAPFVVVSARPASDPGDGNSDLGSDAGWAYTMGSDSDVDDDLEGLPIALKVETSASPNVEARTSFPNESHLVTQVRGSAHTAHSPSKDTDIAPAESSSHLKPVSSVPSEALTAPEHDSSTSMQPPDDVVALAQRMNRLDPQQTSAFVDDRLGSYHALPPISLPTVDYEDNAEGDGDDQNYHDCDDDDDDAEIAALPALRGYRGIRRSPPSIEMPSDSPQAPRPDRMRRPQGSASQPRSTDGADAVWHVHSQGHSSESPALRTSGLAKRAAEPERRRGPVAGETVVSSDASVSGDERATAADRLARRSSSSSVSSATPSGVGRGAFRTNSAPRSHTDGDESLNTRWPRGRPVMPSDAHGGVPWSPPEHVVADTRRNLGSPSRASRTSSGGSLESARVRRAPMNESRRASAGVPSGPADASESPPAYDPSLPRRPVEDATKAYASVQSASAPTTPHTTMQTGLSRDSPRHRVLPPAIGAPQTLPPQAASPTACPWPGISQAQAPVNRIPSATSTALTSGFDPSSPNMVASTGPPLVAPASAVNGGMSFLDCVVELLKGSKCIRKWHVLNACNAWLWLGHEMKQVHVQIEPRKGPKYIENFDVSRVRRLKATDREISVTLDDRAKSIDITFPTRLTAQTWLQGLCCLIPTRASVKSRLKHLQQRESYDPLQDSWSGKLISSRKHCGEYILLGTIGKGASSKVKLALSGKNLRFFAIKVMSLSVMRKQNRNSPFHRVADDYSGHGSATDSPGVGNLAAQSDGSSLAGMDLPEVTAMARLDHPNIVKLVQTFDNPENGRLYIVVDYVARGSVLGSSKLVGAARESEHRVREIVLDVVAGLHHMHSNGVAHRDLKPENLLEAGDRTIKISDFGAAAIYDDNRPWGAHEYDGSIQAQAHRTTVGTPAFTAPELCLSTKGPPAPPKSFAADIWSLGATMFYMIYGQAPFLAKSVFEMYDTICSSPLEFPDAPYASQHAKKLMVGMMEKDPQLRATLETILESPWFAEDQACAAKAHLLLDTIREDRASKRSSVHE